MNLHVKKFDELTTHELYAILRERLDIFIVEQNCPYHECDDKDQKGLHLWLDDGGKLASYLRVLPPGVKDDAVHFTRVVTPAGYRRRGLSSRLLDEAKKIAAEQWPGTPIKLYSQAYAQELYARAGFAVCSEPFLEDGIWHVDMVLKW